MAYQALDIANWFITKANENGEITHLKVQKLMYYAEAWVQVLLDKELFNEKIQAWAHGPVVPEVFSKFKEYSWNPISSQEKCIELESDIEQILIDVFDTYANIPAKNLEQMTHLETPWIEARGNLPAEARCDNIIDKIVIKEFFLKKYEKVLNEKEELA